MVSCIFCKYCSPFNFDNPSYSPYPYPFVEIAQDTINELTEPDVINLIQLLIFKGKTLANLHKTRDSAKAYHYSLSVRVDFIFRLS